MASANPPEPGGPEHPLVQIEIRGLACLVTMNRPEVRNALSGALVRALLRVLDEIESSAARALVLTGAGGDFCAGADLKVLQHLATRTRAENLADSRELAQLFRRIRTYPKPVVAAVRGFALAGGAGLAAVCDRVVTAGDATFGFTEARIGFVAAIVARFLAERTGWRVARDLLLTARRVAAAEALALGLVDELVPAGDTDAVVARAIAWADGLRPCSPQSLALTKRLLAELPGRELDAALDLAAELNADTRATADCREGVAAFLEKRKPRWLT